MSKQVRQFRKTKQHPAATCNCRQYLLSFRNLVNIPIQYQFSLTSLVFTCSTLLSTQIVLLVGA